MLLKELLLLASKLLFLAINLLQLVLVICIVCCNSSSMYVNYINWLTNFLLKARSLLNTFVPRFYCLRHAARCK